MIAKFKYIPWFNLKTQLTDLQKLSDKLKTKNKILTYICVGTSTAAVVEGIIIFSKR